MVGTKTPPTVRQYIGRATVKYRARYLEIILPESPWLRYDRPEHYIPRSDHAFQIGPHLVSRPYGLSHEGIKELWDWAAKYDLELLIGAPSSWHPSTLVVIAAREEFVNEFEEGAKQYGDAFEATLSNTVYYEIYSATHAVKKTWNHRETGIYILDPSRCRQAGVEGLEADISHYLKAQEYYQIGGQG